MSNRSPQAADGSYLEKISLNDKSIYFNRMKNMPANYYHWHQCVEIPVSYTHLTLPTTPYV